MPGESSRVTSEPPNQDPAPTQGWFAELWAWFDAHTALVGWLFVGSLVSLLVVAALLPVLVVRLAPDHFLTSRRELVQRGGLYRWSLRIGKNLLGLLFLLAGLLMLVLPGQGLLTILIGLLMLEFPGKRALELRLVRRPAILGFLNRLRERRGRPPLQVD